MTRAARTWRAADRLAVAVVVAWSGYAALGPNLFGRTPWPDTMVDYHLIYDFGRQIAATKAYPPKHAYPPSAIALHYAAALPPYPVSAAAYLGLTVAASLTIWWVLARALGLVGRPGAGVLVLLAFALSNYFFAWDLKSQNCNLLFLLAVVLGAAALAAGRPAAAAFWLALSVSLKLFSVLLLPYLAWRREWRAVAWAAAFLAVFWVAIPVLAFGPGGTVQVYRSWFRELSAVAVGQADLNHPILISLHNSAARLTGGDAAAAARLVTAFRVAWLVVGLVGLAAAWRRVDVPGDAFGICADVGLLLLGPIAVSPYLEPYHPVPVALPALLLVAAAADARQRPGLRLAAALAFLTGLALMGVPGAWGVRGLLVNLTLLPVAGGAAVVAAVRRLPPVAIDLDRPAVAGLVRPVRAAG